jgi:L-malate glycosyltransferase
MNSRPVPILLMVRELNLGGIEHDVTKIAIHIDRSRFQPHVASYHTHGIRYDELRRANVPLLHLPLSSFLSRAAILSALRFWRYIVKHRIRLVHAYDTSAAFAVPLARGIGVPVVLSSQLGSRSLFDPRTHRQIRWTDRMVDTVIVNCEAMRNHLIFDEGVPRERIELCYNGVDSREFFPWQGPKPDPLTDSSLVIGTICVLRREKSLDVLQEAFARIRHLDSRMKLVIVGSGPELARLQANSKRLGLENANIFLPATPHVATFMRAIDIFVSSSRSEAFSNSILEAMACGCCIVGSRVGGTPELIGNDERGLLFRVGDPADLADRLSSLISSESLRQTLSTKAVQFAKDCLSIEIAAHRMAEIYDKMLRKTTG